MRRVKQVVLAAIALGLVVAVSRPLFRYPRDVATLQLWLGRSATARITHRTSVRDLLSLGMSDPKGFGLVVVLTQQDGQQTEVIVENIGSKDTEDDILPVTLEQEAGSLHVVYGDRRVSIDVNAARIIAKRKK